MAAEPTFQEIADSLLKFLGGSDVCGFNLKRFDLPLLRREFARAGHSFDLNGRAIIDVMELYHRLEPRDLRAAVRFYLGREHQAGHSSLADALAAAEVLGAMVGRYPGLPRDVPGLHGLFDDGEAVDADGFFRRVESEVRFARGRHRGEPLAAVALTSPGYLGQMPGQDLFDDTRL